MDCDGGQWKMINFFVMGAVISTDTLHFLEALAEHNQREWFEANRSVYEQAHKNMIAFAESLLAEMQKHDQIVHASGKRTLMRIYRDVRFSKDKSPYKNYWGGGLKRDTPDLRGGYYFHIQPGKSYVGGGFWGPNKEDLLRIRQDIAGDDEPLREIISDEHFQKMFGELGGDKVKTNPKGFSKDHPAIDLIRHKQFIVSRSFTDGQVTSDTFIQEIVRTYVAMRPFFNYMSEVLTTDANGIPLHESRE